MRFVSVVVALAYAQVYILTDDVLDNTSHLVVIS